MPRHLCTRTTATRARLLALSCAPIVSMFICPQNHARADATWIATGSGLWSTATNWSSDPLVPNGQDQNVLFGNTTLAPATVTLSATPFTVGSLTFDSSFGYTLAATTSNLTLSTSTSTGSASITVNNSFANVANTLSTPILFASPTTITNNDLPGAAQNNLTLSGALSGSQTLTLAGPGQVVFSGTNSAFTGAISLNNGTLFASSSTALGAAGTSTLDGTTINANATLAINTPAAVANEFLTLNGGTLKANTASAVSLNQPLAITADSLLTASSHSAFTLHALTGSSNLTLSTANFTLAGAGATNTFTGNLYLTNAASANLTGSLVNSGSVTLNPGTQFTVSLPVGTDPALNSLRPGTLIATNAEVGVSADIDFRPALSANSTLTGILFNTNNATLGGSNSLGMNAFNNPSSLRLGGTGSIAPTMDLRPDLATHTLRFGLSDYAANNLTVNATLTDHDNTPENLDISGGTTTLAANNTYSGTTTIANGTLVITNPNALGTASGTAADATTINANGTLKLAANVTLANEKITVNATGTLIGANRDTSIFATPITMNGGTLNIGTYTGTIAGAGNFTIGSATLAGVGVYTGTATILGNARVTAGSALSDSGTNIVGYNASLTIASPTTAPLVVVDGTIYLDSGTTLTASPITLVNGTLAAVDLTSTYANPITITGPSTLGAAIFSGQYGGSANFTISGATLSGVGVYTASATVTGNTTVTSASAFSATGTTLLSGGNITLQGPVSAPFRVNGANVTLAGNVTIPAPITVSNGTFTGIGAISTPITVNGNITLGGGSISQIPTTLTLNGLIGNGNVLLTDTSVGNLTSAHIMLTGSSVINTLRTSGGSFIFSGDTTVTGPTSLTGGLPFFTGSAHFEGPFTATSANGSVNSGVFDSTVTLNSTSFAFGGSSVFHGPVIPTGAGRTITFTGSPTFDLPLAVTAQTFLFQSNVTLPGLSLTGGNLTSSANATITSSTPIILSSGIVGASLNAPSIVKSGYTTVTTNDLGVASPVALLVNQGALSVNTLNQSSSAAPLGATASTVTVAPANAVINFFTTSNVSLSSPSINLQNSTGILLRGAITGSSTIENPINLGMSGRTVGAGLANQALQFDGPISGGSLTTNGVVALTNATNTYTGFTHATPLPALPRGNTTYPSSIVTNYAGNNSGILGGFSLRNGGSIPQTTAIIIDRSMDFTLDESSVAGAVDALPDTAPVTLNGGSIEQWNRLGPTTETAGPLTFAVSDSHVVPYGNGTLTFQSLSRQTGATAFFDLGQTIGSNQAGKLLFTTAPALTNGIIGGWAVTNHYDPNPNIGLSGQIFATYGPNGVGPLTNFTILSAAGPNDNVFPGGGNLTADKTINSIAGGNIDLSGHALAIKSGGFILSGTVSNGSLTAGTPGTGGELFLYTGTSTANLSATVADNAGGAVSLVKAGRFGLSLSGANSYSGPTVINEGTLDIESATAIPANNTLKANGGIVRIDYSNANTTLQLSSLELRQNALITSVTQASTLSNTALSANSYLIESGTLLARLVGNGPMQKTTPGTAFIAATSNEYSGTIDISRGVLVPSLSPTALGTGLVRVHSGAYLVNNIYTLTNPIELAGDLSGSSVNNLTTNPGTVIFAGPITVTGPATITTFDTLANLTTIGSAQNITLSGPVTIQSAASLTKIAGGTLQFNAGVSNNGTLSLTEGATFITAITGNGELDILGTASLKISASSHLSTLALAGSPNAWTAALDLAANQLILQPTTSKSPALATLQSQVTFGASHANGAGGITSSVLPANTALAVIDNAITGFTTFGGQPVDADSILIAPELLGDANADGAVDLNDLNTVLNHLGQTTPNWTDGNFDYAATIDLNDLNAVLNNLGTSYANNATVINAESLLTASAPTPEPTTLSLLALLSPILLRRRRPE